MSSCERVPTEIWLEIFGHLPLSALKQTSVTHREFKIPSRTLLFSRFHLGPYAIFFSNCRVPVTDNPTIVQRHLERIEFWSSAEIAPLVRECTIHAGGYEYGGPGPDPLTSTVLAAFFDRFEVFTGLKKLSARRAHFSQIGVTRLCQSSVLDDLEMEDCHIIPGEYIDTTGLQLRLSNFRYTQPWSQTRPTEEKADLWIPLLHPEPLRVLDVSVDPHLELMNETMALGPVFPHVHTLRTKFDPAILSRNRLAWDKFPGVHSLSLWCWESDTLPLDQAAHRVVPPDVMSLLEEYTGCPQALPLFAARATLRRVDIPQSCLRTLMPSLNWGQSPQITSFSAGLDIMDVTNLSLIFDTFPMLQVISIVVINNDDDDDGGEGGCPDSTGARFFSTVAEAPTLPSTLQYLTLIWESEYRYVNPPESIDGLADIPAMRKKLRERCPALRKVWLEGIHFVSTWRRSDSEEEGEEKTTVGTIGSKGDGHEDFWEGN